MIRLPWTCRSDGLEQRRHLDCEPWSTTPGDDLALECGHRGADPVETQEQVCGGVDGETTVDALSVGGFDLEDPVVEGKGCLNAVADAERDAGVEAGGLR